MIRRYVDTRPIATRAAEGEAAHTIRGHAAVFNQRVRIYDGTYFRYEETIRPGAFARAIAEAQDVRALWNHDANYVLGRTKSGTLRLAEDGVGLVAEIAAAPTRTIEDLVLAPIERGDVSGMSFAFRPRRSQIVRIKDPASGVIVDDYGGERVTHSEEGDIRIEHHEIIDVDLYDVSPVTYPAYDQTDVALRSDPVEHSRWMQLDVPRGTPRIDAARAARHALVASTRASSTNRRK